MVHETLLKTDEVPHLRPPEHSICHRSTYSSTSHVLPSAGHGPLYFLLLVPGMLLLQRPNCLIPYFLSLFQCHLLVRPFLATLSRIIPSMHSHHLPCPLDSNCYLVNWVLAYLVHHLLSHHGIVPWRKAGLSLLLTASRHLEGTGCRIGAQYRSPRVNAATFKRSKGKHTNGIHQHSCSKNCPSKELQAESTGIGRSLPWHRCCDSPAQKQTPISCPRQPSC